VHDLCSYLISKMADTIKSFVKLKPELLK